MSLIHAQNIHKEFSLGGRTTHVLNGIDLQVEQGEFVAIMGRSGAGKSTLLYQLSALDLPSHGVVSIDGVNVLNFSEDELVDFRLYTLGYVFQDYALVADLTIRENVVLPLIMRGMDWESARNIADSTIDRMGLAGLYNRLPTQLSGGEQQRVSIARAVAGKPKILFADEPTANLDSSSGKEVIMLLTELHAKGQTIVMVTHEEEYTKNCNRIIRIEDGKIATST